MPRKSVVRLTDRPDMTLDVYCGRKTTTQQQQQKLILLGGSTSFFLDFLIIPFRSKGHVVSNEKMCWLLIYT